MDASRRVVNGCQQTIEIIHDVHLELSEGDFTPPGPAAAGGVERDEPRSDVKYGGDELPCPRKAGTWEDGYGATQEALKRQCAVREASSQVETAAQAPPGAGGEDVPEDGFSQSLIKTSGPSARRSSAGGRPGPRSGRNCGERSCHCSSVGITWTV